MISAELASNIALSQQEILSHQQEIPLFESENVTISQEDIVRTLQKEPRHPCDKICPKGTILDHKCCRCVENTFDLRVTEEEECSVTQEESLKFVEEDPHPCDKTCPKGKILNHKDCTCIDKWLEVSVTQEESLRVVEENPHPC